MPVVQLIQESPGQTLPALGDFAGTPLGLAGADRMRGAEAYAG
jgi:hypothetical protein